MHEATALGSLDTLCTIRKYDMNASRRSVLEAARAEFTKEYPEEKILVCDLAKGILTREDAAQMEDYVSIQECLIILSDRRIKANQWNIKLSDITKASLVKHTGKLFEKKTSLILRLRNQPVQYQFELKDEKSWLTQQVLPVHYLQPEKGNYSLLIILAMVIIGIVVMMVL